MVALLTAVLIALFLFSLGVLLGVQGNTSISGGELANQSDKAEALAQAGIQDALLKIARTGSAGAFYTLTETDGTINVSVVAGLGGSLTVDATGTVARGPSIVQRSIHADVTLDGDGKITSVIQKDQ